MKRAQRRRRIPAPDPKDVIDPNVFERSALYMTLLGDVADRPRHGPTSLLPSHLKGSQP